MSRYLNFKITGSNKYLSLRFFNSHQTEQPIVAACSKSSLYKKAGSASILHNRISNPQKSKNLTASCLVA